ncbi:hypothetical protein C8F01DRAFT_1079914 [Mycena amicta]|nr:hypothetical protein C8F01DRAFT_1079914 [Mycena amicta]
MPPTNGKDNVQCYCWRCTKQFTQPEGKQHRRSDYVLSRPPKKAATVFEANNDNDSDGSDYGDAPTSDSQQMPESSISNGQEDEFPVQQDGLWLGNNESWAREEGQSVGDDEMDELTSKFNHFAFRRPPLENRDMRGHAGGLWEPLEDLEQMDRGASPVGLDEDEDEDDLDAELARIDREWYERLARDGLTATERLARRLYSIVAHGEMKSHVLPQTNNSLTTTARSVGPMRCRIDIWIRQEQINMATRDQRIA